MRKAEADTAATAQTLGRNTSIEIPVHLVTLVLWTAAAQESAQPIVIAGAQNDLIEYHQRA